MDFFIKFLPTGSAWFRISRIHYQVGSRVAVVNPPGRLQLSTGMQHLLLPSVCTIGSCSFRQSFKRIAHGTWGAAEALSLRPSVAPGTRNGARNPPNPNLLAWTERVEQNASAGDKVRNRLRSPAQKWNVYNKNHWSWRSLLINYWWHWQEDRMPAASVAFGEPIRTLETVAISCEVQNEIHYLIHTWKLSRTKAQLCNRVQESPKLLHLVDEREEEAR